MELEIEENERLAASSSNGDGFRAPCCSCSNSDEPAYNSVEE